MSDVPEPPKGAKFEDPSIPPPVDPPPDPPPPAVDFTNPAAVRTWLSLLRAHLLDALGAAEDGAKAPRERMFSRYEVQRRLAQEERVLLALLDEGERGVRRIVPSRP